MNTRTQTSNYESPLREHQKAQTRERLLDAAGRLMTDDRLGELTLAAVAREAGVRDRTLYRHFATKDALLEALWTDWLDPRIGLGSFPASEEALLAAPPRVFPAFDANEGLMRAFWSTPQGRDFRLRMNEDRKKAIRASVADATEGLSAEETLWIAAACQLLYSGAAWMTMKDYWGLSGAEAGKASAFAISLLLSAARNRSGAAPPDTEG